MSNLMKQALENSQPIRARFPALNAVPMQNIEPPESLPKGFSALVDDFPFYCLPACIQQAAQEVARFGKVSKVSPAIVAISTAATAIRKKAYIEERGGLNHNPALFMCAIAESGERKSPVFEKMTSPLTAYEENQKKINTGEKARVIVRNELVNSQIKKLNSDVKKDFSLLDDVVNDLTALESSKKSIPVEASFFTSDTTEERLFQKMYERDESYAVMSGEGRPVIDAILGKFTNGNLTGDALFLAGISGDRVSRDRVGGKDGAEEKVMYNPCLNVCIMVQPDKYISLAKNDTLMSSGAIARIWPVWIPSLMGTRIEEKNEDDFSEQSMEAYNSHINSILEIDRSITEDGLPNPLKVSLSVDSAEKRRLFHNELELEMGDKGEFSDMRALASKAVSQTCKLALVLHIVNDPSKLDKVESFIEVDEWERAEKIGRYFFKCAVHSHQLLKGTSAFQKAEKLLVWLENKGYSGKVVTKSQIKQFGPRPRLSEAEFNRVISVLTAKPYHWLEPIPGKSTEFKVHASLAKGEI